MGFQSSRHFQTVVSNIQNILLDIYYKRNESQVTEMMIRFQYYMDGLRDSRFITRKQYNTFMQMALEASKWGETPFLKFRGELPLAIKKILWDK